MNSYGKHSFENLDKLNFTGVGSYGIPQIHPEPTISLAESWLAFNFFKTEAPGDKGLHFFVDDYQFTRLWRYPDKYIQTLQRFQCLCSPDFSLYTNMPVALQVYNHFRKHWLAAYWQLHGMTVIPSIAWSDRESYRWCFDGEPTHSPVAVSSVGTLKAPESRRLFLEGFQEMLCRLEPSLVLFYGDIPPECGCNAPLLQLEAYHCRIARARMAAHGR